MEYISTYVGENGKDYLFVLVVCTAMEALLYAEKEVK